MEIECHRNRRNDSIVRRDGGKAGAGEKRNVLRLGSTNEFESSAAH